MSPTLVIFDHSMDQGLLNKIPDAADNMELFPLISDWRGIDEVLQKCTDNFKNAHTLKLLNSAEMINDEIIRMRRNIPKWSACMGNRKVGNKIIKDWFQIGDTGISSWWFSLLSEKNPFKTDMFLKIAQFQAIVSILKSGRYDNCYLFVKDEPLRQAICKFETQSAVSIFSRGRSSGKIKAVRSLMERLGTGKDLLRDMGSALLWLFVFWARSLLAGLILGNPAKRRPEGSILFVSYFPFVNTRALEEGRFQNKFAIPLQEKFHQAGQKIIWMFLYVNIDGWSFKDAVQIAKKIKRLDE